MLMKQKMFVGIPQYSTTPTLMNADMTEYGYTMYGEVEVQVEFEMPSEAEQKRKLVESLQKQKSNILAECHRKTSIIQDKIDSLLCIEMEVSK